VLFVLSQLQALEMLIQLKNGLPFNLEQPIESTSLPAIPDIISVCN